MAKNGKSLDQRTFDKLRRLYIIGFSTIAVSVIVSQILIRTHLAGQESDSTVINIAGRQRMLSQKLAKHVVSLSSTSSLEEQLVITNNLKETLHLWELSHNSLQNGNDSLRLPNANSDAVLLKFAALNPVFDTIAKASKSIISKIENTGVNTSTYLNDVTVVKANEAAFLKQMDAIVNQYDAEAEEKVAWLRKLEFWLTILTLVILLGEFLFIFWPAAKSVKITLAELLFAEKRAKQMAFDADELSRSKEKSIKELRALSHAMDDTLLFARILPSGLVVHMGSKFSRLFKYPKFNQTAFFWDILTSDSKEKEVIESLILKFKNTGWQGEIKATTREGNPVWLEMAIIPYSPTDDKAELLIIASEISERKMAQLEIGRLTEKSFQEKMSQQKIMSSKIIENQEKEQNRIAKDVHDGIGQMGIVPAITKLTQELARLTGKDILLLNKTSFNERLDSLAEINIYRITQEAINNAIKYAESTHIVVSMSHSEGLLSIVIDDNGKGFDPDKVKHVKTGDGGMGMTFMRERMKYIDGRLFLHSEQGKGTRITLNIPLV